MTRFPHNIYIFGAGRWARVYCSVLLKLPIPSNSITVISPNHSEVMRKWKESQHLPIRVLNHFPKNDFGSNVAIVVNKAENHAATAKFLIEKHIPTLIEKPMATSVTDIKELIELAVQKKTYLAVSHIFLFAGYIQRFKRLISAVHSINSISFVWEDMQAEERYGESKIFDESIFVVQDVFPHIYCILQFLFSTSKITLQKCEKNEKMEAVLNLLVGNTPCKIMIKRNGLKRKRIIKITAPQGNFALDFSTEAGEIISRDKSYNACPIWNEQLSPLSKQLMTFFAEYENIETSPRFTPEIDLACAQIIEHYNLTL